MSENVAELINQGLGVIGGELALPDMRLKKDVKHCRAWRCESPHIGDDLEYQIYFKAKFSDLLVNKVISKLTTKIAAGLADSKFAGDFLIDVLPDAKAVIITQKGFWKDFSASPDAFAKVVDDACEELL